MRLVPRLIATALAASVLPTSAQEPSAEPSVEQVKTYVTQLHTFIDQREVVATDMVNRILAADRSIQAAVEQVLALVKNAKDSEASGTRIANIKQDVMRRLGKAAEMYAQQRALIAEDLRTTQNDYAREDLFKARGSFDERINNMVDQIVGLATTMQTHEDHEKYLVEGGGGWGWGGQTIVKNPEYEQNQKQTQKTRQTENELDKAFATAVDRADRGRRDIAEKLKNPALTDEQRTQLTAELERWDNLLAERTQQQSNLSNPDAMTPGTDALDRDQAGQITELIEALAAGARRDFQTMISTLGDLRQEKASIATLKTKLDFSNGWLKEKGVVVE